MSQAANSVHLSYESCKCIRSLARTKIVSYGDSSYTEIYLTLRLPGRSHDRDVRYRGARTREDEDRLDRAKALAYSNIHVRQAEISVSNPAALPRWARSRNSRCESVRDRHRPARYCPSRPRDDALKFLADVHAWNRSTLGAEPSSIGTSRNLTVSASPVVFIAITFSAHIAHFYRLKATRKLSPQRRRRQRQFYRAYIIIASAHGEGRL